MSYVNERFFLDTLAMKQIHRLKPQFGYNGFGEITYYRSYSREILDDLDEVIGQEHWADTVIRVINGVFSIRKDWNIRNRIGWNEEGMQAYAFEMAIALFQMHWLPPGRGLWSMGTDLIYERGAMALYNCAAIKIGAYWVEDLSWLMNTLMWGVGVGFKPERIDLELEHPTFGYKHVIDDTREAWCESFEALCNAYIDPEYGSPEFDYSMIRPEGALIRSFGGLASGPGPLMAMHEDMKAQFEGYIEGTIDVVELLTNLANLIGVCVVTGNVRRSAQIGLGDFSDPVFRHLKDYSKFPNRKSFGWMSNNSVYLDSDDDFMNLDMIAQANIEGHDLGYINLRNLPKGRIRIGEHDTKKDIGTLFNPCGEIILENKEVCNVAETLPTRCTDIDSWLRACEYATFYCSTVALLPTHQPETNAVVMRNRRIGVSIIDFQGWKLQHGVCEVTNYLRRGYNAIKAFNRKLADEAGVPESIRVTAIKPGGTVPKLAGRTSGIGHPTFSYTIRRIRVQANTNLERLLIAAGIPHEPDHYSKQTTTFEYPIIQGPAVPATEVSLWEQAFDLILIQREWADNAVSNTLYFKPKWALVGQGSLKDLVQDLTINGINIGRLYQDGAVWFESGRHRVSFDYEAEEYKVYCFNPNHEEDMVEAVLSHIAPLTKSVSLLPHSDMGFMPQMPEEGITKAEYERRLAAIKPIDWSTFSGSDGQDERFCQGERCEINPAIS